MASENQSIESLVRDFIAKLREKLIDPSNRNRLINFKHTDRSRRQIRVIDENPSFILSFLQAGNQFRFESLPERIRSRPSDENDDEFLLLLEEARNNDEDYLLKSWELEEEEGKDVEVGVQKRELERELRNKVREQIGWKPWVDPETMSLAEYALSLDIPPEFDLPREPVDDDIEEKHTDNKLQVLFEREQMLRKLTGIYSAYRESIQEKGVSTLYVAIGFLDWKESEEASTNILSPLILVPITMTRPSKGGPKYYRIESSGEEPVHNHSLGQRLQTEFAISLPDFSSDISAEEYFQAVEEEISEKKGWKVRSFVTVGHFQYGQIATWADLAPERWNPSLEIRDVLQRILSGVGSDISSDGESWNEDSDKLDHYLEVVMDADGSQLEALTAINSGRSFVLKGPPGTGKSQTIANAIALLIRNGKSVLFMAEKLAALNVVKKRLDDVGLGHFCLELHSTKTKKKELLENLTETIKNYGEQQQSTDLERQQNEYKEISERLNGYAALVNSPYGDTGKTIHDYLWAAIRSRNAVGEKYDLRSLAKDLKGIENLDSVTVDELRGSLKKLEEVGAELKDKYGSIDNDPWRAANCEHLSVFQKEDLEELLDNLIQLGGELASVSAAKQLTGQLDLPENFTDLLSLISGMVQFVQACRGQRPAANTDGDKQPLLDFLTAGAQLVTQRLERYGFDRPYGTGHLAAGLNLLDLIREIYPTEGVHLPTLIFRNDASAVLEAIESEDRALIERQTQLDKKYQLDLIPDVDELSSWEGEVRVSGLLSFFSARHRKAKAALSSIYRGVAPKDKAELLHDISEISSFLRDRRKLLDQGDVKDLLGISGKDIQLTVEDAREKHRLITQIRKLLTDNGVEWGSESGERLRNTILDEVSRADSESEVDTGAAENFIEEFNDNYKKLLKLLNIKQPMVDDLAANNLTEGLTEEFLEKISQFRHSIDDLDNRSSYVVICNQVRDKLGTEIGLKIISIYEENDEVVSVFNAVYNRSITENIIGQNPMITSYTARSIDNWRSELSDLDKQLIDSHRKIVTEEITQRSVPPGVSTGSPSNYTDIGLILHEDRKKKRHLAVRQLLNRAGGAIQALKPCFMFSPRSVAQFLEPSKFTFDVLLIDEASQMKPEYAIGGMARAKQVIVVGDEKQLPPTAFGERYLDDTESDGEDYADVQSILELADSALRPSKELRWHYRSRHDSLIAYSNREFYDDRLVVFPSATNKGEIYGLQYEKVQGTFVAKKNINEARKVRSFAINYMKRHPELSIGIVAMNRDQMVLIEDLMTEAFQTDDALAEYREKWEKGIEPFIVKNLENMQGDERDIIIISMTYGPDDSGRVMQRFGPITHSNGHRRLNVLFTRAKNKMLVVSSMHPDDIRVTPTSSRGVRVMREFLEYAATGRLEVGKGIANEVESDFELEVVDFLRNNGYEAIPQVGVAGFRIDVGVKHHSFPYGYLAGVECDGASYHAQEFARDRDRLRKEILKGYRWDILNIWSTSWFNNCAEEKKILLNRLQDLLDKKVQEMDTNDEYIGVDSDLDAPDQDKNVVTQNVNVNNVVGVGSTVEYVDVDSPENVRRVVISSDPSDPTKGVINSRTALAGGLIGLPEGEESEILLPDNNSMQVRIISIKRSGHEAPPVIQ